MLKAKLKIKTQAEKDMWLPKGTELTVNRIVGLYAFCAFNDVQDIRILLAFLDMKV